MGTLHLPSGGELTCPGCMASDQWWAETATFDTVGLVVITPTECFGAVPTGARHLYCNACGCMIALGFIEQQGIWISRGV